MKKYLTVPNNMKLNFLNQTTRSVFAILLIICAKVGISAVPTWSVTPANFQYSMTVTAVANINCNELGNPSNIIGAFVGSTCRGVAYTSNVIGGRYTASLVVYSNASSGETITFKMYNVATDSAYTALTTAAFQDNANYGASANPFVIRNNNQPTAITLSATTVNAGVAIGTVIGTLSSTDPDAGQTFTYSLVSGSGSADNSHFTITGNQLKTAVAMSYQSQNAHNIRLRTTDNFGCTYEQNYTINVNFVNSPPTQIFITDTSINENAPILTAIGTFSDLDVDTNEIATYALVSGIGDTNNVLFNISGNTLRSSAIFNYEVKNAYSIRVRVTDKGSNTFDRIFRIIIKDINDAPTNILINGNTVGTSFAENRLVGSLIGYLSTIDEDALNSFTYTFASISGNDNSSFQIVNNQLRTAASFDFENRQVYSIYIQTSDGNGGLFSKQLILNVSDSNDAPTAISLGTNAVNENQPIGTFITKLFSNDQDVNDTSFIYTLVNGAGSSGNSNFSIRNDSLFTAAIFDFESISTYSIRIMTNDKHSGLFQQAFTININNINDAPTDIALSVNSINENTSANTIIGAFSSTDQDVLNTFSYSLVSGTGSTDNSSFNISGGSLRSSIVFDYETKSSYSIRVRTDDGHGGTFDKVFTININNTNDNPTNISISKDSITENRPVNSLIGNLTTTDQDAGDSFIYSFVNTTGNNNNSFVLVGNQLRSSSIFDFEAKSIYYIYIQADDQHGGTYTKQFAITIKDTNDAPSDISLSIQTINENKPIGSFIGKFSSSDQDPGNTFTYALVSGTGSTNNGSFFIRNDSLFTGTLLDYTIQNTYSIRASTTDNASGSFQKVFSIIINRVNQAPTGMTLSGTAVSENQPIGTTFASLNSIARDSGKVYVYSLVSGVGSNDNNAFTIISNQLKTNAVFNYEVKKSYLIRIQTNDGLGGTFTDTFRISILDANDAPSNVSITNNSVPENRNTGGLIALINTTDEDSADSFTYTFANITPNDNNSFVISGNQLRNNVVFDYESKSLFVIYVTSNDGKGGSYTKQLTINVTDSNDAPTDEILSNNNIRENAPVHTFIDRLNSSDPDRTNQTFSYSLISGVGSTNNNSFSISNDSLYTNQVFDFETKNTYSIRIKSTDQGLLSAEKVFTIAITDQNDAPTDLTISNNAITENMPARTFIGSFNSSDQDAGDMHTYTLVNGTGSTNNNSFLINGNFLKSNAVFDFETKSSYSIRVQSNDGAGGIFEQVIVININDTNDAPTQIALSSTNIAENAPAGSSVGVFSSTDQDATDNHYYSMVNIGVNDNNAFFIIGNELKTNMVFNYEMKKLYLVSVQSSDGNGGTITRQFVINIKDSADKPTDIAVTNTIVPENQPIRTFIGQFSSTDEDVAQSHAYTLVNGVGATNNNKFYISNDSVYSNAMFDFESKASYSIRVRTTDADNLFFEKAFTISITNTNDTPTAIIISNASLDENMAISSTIGLFSTTDQDSGDTFTYSLVNGTGSTDNGGFTIKDNKLYNNFIPDFETKSSYSIRVRTMDGGALYKEMQFIIHINDINEKPVLELDTFKVSEDASLGTLVGTLKGTNPESTQLLHFTLESSIDEVLPFNVNATNGDITIKSALDYNKNSVYVLKVILTDNGNPVLSDSGYIIIKVQEVLKTKQLLPATNYISPNGDGVNDNFVVRNVELYKDYSLHIFNEAGLVLYSVDKNYNNDWNGTYGGNALPTGVYFYVFKNENTGHTFKGSINIVQ